MLGAHVAIADLNVYIYIYIYGGLGIEFGHGKKIASKNTTGLKVYYSRTHGS